MNAIEACKKTEIQIEKNKNKLIKCWEENKDNIIEIINSCINSEILKGTYSARIVYYLLKYKKIDLRELQDFIFNHYQQLGYYVDNSVDKEWFIIISWK